MEALLESGQGEKAMSILEKSRIPMIDAGEHEVVSRLLNELAARLPGRLEPLEWLVETYGRTSDSFRLPDALAQLGDALVAANQFDRAKQVFEQLVDREPESDSAKRKLNDVLRKMGLLGRRGTTASCPGASRARTSQSARTQSSPRFAIRGASGNGNSKSASPSRRLTKTRKNSSRNPLPMLIYSLAMA